MIRSAQTNLGSANPPSASPWISGLPQTFLILVKNVVAAAAMLRNMPSLWAGSSSIASQKDAAPEHLSDNKGAAEKHLSGERKVPLETTKGAIKVQKGAVE